MSEEDKKEEQTIVDEHRKMVMMTGNLSDFQLENLKKWPFLLFDGLEKVKVDYDFTKLIAEQEELSPGMVTYNLHMNSNAPSLTEEVKGKKIEILTNWTKFLFWKETSVRINFKS